MSLEDEDNYLGMESHLVPQVPAGDKCYAKKTENVQDEERGTLTLFRGYCRATAGKQTDHHGEGRCKHHGGCAGGPEHNQNAATHSLTADPHHYHESLEDEEAEFVLDASAAIEDRVRAVKGDVDYLDRILARRIAVKLHMVARASDYTGNVVGMVQTIFTEDGTFDQKTPLVEEIRRFDDSIFGNLKDLGVMDDPETKKAEALDSWRQFVEQ